MPPRRPAAASSRASPGCHGLVGQAGQDAGETADVLDAAHGYLLSAGVVAVGLVKEAVVVVFDQVRSLEQRVAAAAVGRGRSPQQAGDAPQAIATGFRPGAAGSV
jgi:hypothetical protein